MGLAYEEYCEAMYEREFCMSDVDCGCIECDNKSRELEECYDGYHLFRVELEKILDIVAMHVRGDDQDIMKITKSIFRLCTEAGIDYTTKFEAIRAVK